MVLVKKNIFQSSTMFLKMYWQQGHLVQGQKGPKVIFVILDGWRRVSTCVSIYMIALAKAPDLFYAYLQTYQQERVLSENSSNSSPFTDDHILFIRIVSSSSQPIRNVKEKQFIFFFPSFSLVWTMILNKKTNKTKVICANHLDLILIQI